MLGTLYIIATPIGNLEDITLRALSTLKSVDVILCEDTRVTKNMLDRYEISKPLLSYHHHSDTRKTNEIKSLLEEGKNLALVTDAGTPGISDPGNQLVSDLVKSFGNLDIIPIPGPSTLTAILSVSGFPTDRFTFMGFPPHKNKRQKYFEEVAKTLHTVVFFESGHRIEKCLTDLEKVLEPNRELVIGRELTKKFETIYRGNISEIKKQSMNTKGEFVIVVANI